MEQIVRAVDLGFGNVKFTTSGSGDNFGMGTMLFPSLVPPPAETTAGTDLISGRRATVTVTVDGTDYEVGPDVEQVLGTRDGRCLHRDFSVSNEYRALLMGALSYMAIPHIDLLVLGLPVNAAPGKQDELKRRFRGPQSVANKRIVHVKDVEVVAQPIGSFLDYAYQRSMLKKIKEQSILIIDVGFFTLDWVVMKGGAAASARTGGYDAGVSEVLKRMQKAIAADLNCEAISINRLDQALRSGELKVFGHNHQISRWLPSGRSAISEGLNALQGRVGSTDDIDAVFVSGGGAGLYVEAVRKAFPRHQVDTLPGAVFSNVRGFQVFGELKTGRTDRVAA